MRIAVDQSKLRTIVEAILAGEDLTPAEATLILQIAQLAAGSDDREQVEEHCVLQAIAQHIGSYIGTKESELSAIPRIDDPDARLSWLGALAAGLHSRPARELAFVMAFLVSISDLELVPAELDALEELQIVLEVDHRRATDLVVQLTETLASRAA